MNYQPESASVSQGRFTSSNQLALLLSCILACVVLALNFPDQRFSPDSWNYYELSQTVFGDFYKISTIRQYQYASDYGSSFPPLYPVLLACCQLLLGQSIYVGIALNVVICIATLFRINRLCNVLSFQNYLSILIFIALLLNQEYIHDLLAGRTAALSILVLINILIQYFNTSQSTAQRALWLGFWCGIGGLTRFDFLIYGLMLGLLQCSEIYLQKHSFKNLILYSAVFVMLLSPWCIYSYCHFNKPFVSDNSAVMLIAEPTHVANYYAPQEALPTIGNAPMQWLHTLITHKLKANFKTVINCVFDNIAVQLLIGLLAGYWLFSKNDQTQSQVHNILPYANRVWLILGAQIAQYVAVGYADARYYIPLYLYSIIYCFIRIRMPHLNNLTMRSKVMLIMIISLYILGFNYSKSSLLSYYSTLQLNLQTNSAIDHDLVQELSKTKQANILFLSNNSRMPIKQFGALTNIKNSSKPLNLTTERLEPFIETFRFTHCYDETGEWTSKKMKNYQFVPTAIPYLYKIKMQSITSS